MIKILENSNKMIYTRGDTGCFEAVPYMVDATTKAKTAYTFQTGDLVEFCVRKTEDKDSEILIDEFSDDGKFNISPSKTENLVCGDYRYSVTLKCANGDKFTYITGANLKPAVFTLAERTTT